MTDASLERALRESEELELVTRGRRSGDAHAVRLWFAADDGAIWLRGDRAADWLRNLERDPSCTIRIGELELRAAREPAGEEAAALRRVVELWRAKYGAEWVGDWYVERGRVPVRLRLVPAT